MAWPVGFSRAILFFQAPEGEGFSEEYLFKDQLDLESFQIAVQVLGNARLEMLSTRYTLVHSRLNYPHDPRTLLPNAPTFILPKPGKLADLDFERVEVGALATLFTESGRFCTRIFRGVQSDVVDIDGRLDPNHAWTGKFTEFLDVLLADPACGLINVRQTATLAPYTFAQYNNYNIGHTSTRDSGRPFGLRRGRISA